MRVLIVHDRPEISEKIKDAIAKDMLAAVIDVADHYVSASQKFRTNVYDLAIVDLTLPHLPNRSANYETARDLLHELMESPDLNAPGDLIGITKDIGALKIVSVDVGSHLMTVIEEDEHDLWLARLLEKVKYVSRASSARYEATASSYEFDVLVLTALDEELSPYRGLFEFIDRKEPGLCDFGFYDSAGKMRRGIAKAIGKPGPAAAASWTQSLISRFRPRLCVMSGLCGGVTGKAQLGDCLVFENVFDWDFGKWKHDPTHGVRFYSRPEPIGIRDTQAHRIARILAEHGLKDQQKVITAAKALVSSSFAKINIAPVPAASGSSVVAHEDISARIKDLNEAISAIDMESYGFYYAATYALTARPEMLCVKSVCDFADKSKDDKWHRICCYLSAQVVRDILLYRWVF